MQQRHFIRSLPLNLFQNMRRILLSLICLLFALSARAMGYEEARSQAWFLTDKMAYELNLTSDQYERAYQINLDYLMSLNSPSDCGGYYWEYRNMDLRCILFDWQYNLYRTLDYFFRPVRWLHAAWHFPVCDRYRRGYYYFDRPAFYVTYRGGMWRRRGHNDPSPYIGLRPNRGMGMRDRYHRPEGHGADTGHRPQPSRPTQPDRRNDGKGTPQRGGSRGQGRGSVGQGSGVFPAVERNNGGRSGNSRGTTGGTVKRGSNNRSGSRSVGSGGRSTQSGKRSSTQTTGRGGNRSFGNR